MCEAWTTLVIEKARYYIFGSITIYLFEGPECMKAVFFHTLDKRQ